MKNVELPGWWPTVFTRKRREVIQWWMISRVRSAYCGTFINLLRFVPSRRRRAKTPQRTAMNLRRSQSASHVSSAAPQELIDLI